MQRAEISILKYLGQSAVQRWSLSLIDSDKDNCYLYKACFSYMIQWYSSKVLAICVHCRGWWSFNGSPAVCGVEGERTTFLYSVLLLLDLFGSVGTFVCIFCFAACMFACLLLFCLYFVWFSLLRCYVVVYILHFYFFYLLLAWLFFMLLFHFIFVPFFLFLVFLSFMFYLWFCSVEICCCFL